MRRLPGDPSVGRWLLFAVGFRLPYQNREWVRHELTDAGWRGRTIRRLMVLMVPICVALAFLPGPVWLRVAVPGFALIASVGTVLISADDIRAARLKQHGLPVPDRPRPRPPAPLTSRPRQRRTEKFSDGGSLGGPGYS